MWFAIAVTVLAASGNNIGKVLQKQATRTLPRLTLKREVIQQYLQSKTWTTGMLTDLAGALLMLVAFANAPVSVVQPVSAIGLVVLLIFSHFHLKERLRFHEWVAAAVAGLGVLGLGVSAEPDHLAQPTASPLHIIGAFLGLVLLLAVECWWRHWLHGTPPRPSINGSTSFKGSTTASTSIGGSSGAAAAATAAANSAAAAADAAMCGLEAGTCFGLSAAACRTGFILANKVSVLFLPLGLGCSVALTTSGFVLQTRGLKAGNTIIVCTLAAVASMVSGVVAGLVALHERMPTGHGMKMVRLASWMCILLGVTSLAGGRKGLSALARMLAARLPPYTSKAWRRIPRPLALLLHKLEKSVMEADDEDDEKLPLVEPAASGGAAAAPAGSIGSSSSNGAPAVFVLPVSIEAADRGPAGMDQRHASAPRE